MRIWKRRRLKRPVTPARPRSRQRSRGGRFPGAERLAQRRVIGRTSFASAARPILWQLGSAGPGEQTERCGASRRNPTPGQMIFYHAMADNMSFAVSSPMVI
jgi:hypothetical protein